MSSGRLPSLPWLQTCAPSTPSAMTWKPLAQLLGTLCHPAHLVGRLPTCQSGGFFASFHRSPRFAHHGSFMERKPCCYVAEQTGGSALVRFCLRGGWGAHNSAPGHPRRPIALLPPHAAVRLASGGQPSSCCAVRAAAAATQFCAWDNFGIISIRHPERGWRAARLLHLLGCALDVAG